MNRFIFAFVSLLLPLTAFAQPHADWANANPYADQRARQSGDMITVLIMEYSEASNEAGTNTKSDVKTNLQFNPSGMLAQSLQGAGLDMPLKHESNNGGETMRRGRVTGKLSVRIIEIDSTGNYRIEGKRVMDVNGDKQIMTLSGSVRPQDIRADNTVYSYDIAGAELLMTGKGTMHKASRPGALTWLFGWIL